MILYSVEGGQADAAGIETAIVDSIGRDCEVTISQDITTGGEQVNVSFAGNQAHDPRGADPGDRGPANAPTPTWASSCFPPALWRPAWAPGSSRSAWCALPSPRCSCWFTSPCASARLAAWPPGVTAVIALMHDVLIAFCVFVIFGLDVDDVFIAVILTILGYSLNATIVVYDRVRENRRKLGPKVGYDEILNLSMNQTLSRTVLTSLCTFLALVVVFIVALIFNIDTVVSFALPMMAGVAAGCFSSQFIAPNLFGMWQIHKRNKLDAAKQKA